VRLPASFPVLRGLPQKPGGSASALQLSRPAQALHVTAHKLAQPPFGGLCHRAPAHAVTRPSRLSATRSNRSLSRWNPPPLATRAFGAHWLCFAKVSPRGQRWTGPSRSFSSPSRGQREGEGEFPAYQGKYQGILKNLDDPIAPETTRLIPVLNTRARRAIADPAACRTINGMGLCYRTITYRQGSSDRQARRTDGLFGRQDESYCGRIQRPHAVR
jgi:hypothetical protein